MQLESLPPSLQTETSSDTLHIKLAAVVAHSGVLSQITNQRIQVRTRNRSRGRGLSNAVVAPSRQKEKLQTCGRRQLWQCNACFPAGKLTADSGFILKRAAKPRQKTDRESLCF